jgi:hypothetical protein
VHKDLRRAEQAGGREVLRVEVIVPSPFLAGGLSRENDRVRDQQKLAGQDSAELVKARLSADHFVREESPRPNPIPAAGATVADIDPLLADTHAFEELRLLSQLHSRPTTLNGAVRSAEALVAQYSYTPDASPQR